MFKQLKYYFLLLSTSIFILKNWEICNALDSNNTINVSNYWLNPTKNGSIKTIINSISDEILLALIPAITLLAIVIGWFYYIRAGEDEGKASEGKKIIKIALTGLVISFLAYGLVTFVGSFTTTIVNTADPAATT